MDKKWIQNFKFADKSFNTQNSSIHLPLLEDPSFTHSILLQYQGISPWVVWVR